MAKLGGGRMKFVFLTVLHRMKVDTALFKGIRVSSGTRITNDRRALSEIFDSSLMQDTAGVHSINEFRDSVIWYRTGDFKDVVSHDGFRGSMYAFHFLREAQQFVYDLWSVKDNGIYVRDGFLVTYFDKIDSGRTWKVSVSTVLSEASGERGSTTFSSEEVRSVARTFIPHEVKDVDEVTHGGKYPTNEPFMRNSNYGRVGRAWYFLVAARAAAIPPMKILFYCTALECLFTTGSSELTHRIAERVAILLGSSAEQRIELFKFVKEAYGFRSTIVHGSSIKEGNEAALVTVCTRLDEVLRQLIVMDHEVFHMKEGDMDRWFLELLFN